MALKFNVYNFETDYSHKYSETHDTKTVDLKDKSDENLINYDSKLEKLINRPLNKRNVLGRNKSSFIINP